MTSPDTIGGACLCGAIRFEADGPPRRVTHCHCSMCRRASGAVAGTFAAFATDQVRWLAEPARYDSSDVAWRGFCPTCGSSVCFGYKPRPERTYIALGIFDDPDAFPAQFHDYRADQLGWLHLDDDLPDAQRP
jgi:hypothetical protein